MKKILHAAIFLAFIVPAFGQSTRGLERWIIGFPGGNTSLRGRTVTRCVIESTGASVFYGKTGTSMRLNIIKPVPLDMLAAKLVRVENALLNDRELVSEKWHLTPRECEIDFGLKDELTVTLRFSSFRLRLNSKTILELAPKLAYNPVFILPPEKETFNSSIAFTGIDLKTSDKAAFPGWAAYAEKVVRWFEEGIDRTDQAILALVQERKVPAMAEEGKVPRIVLPETGKSNLWVGLNLDCIMSNLLVSERSGISFNPGAYELIMPRLYLSWRDLGDPSWIAKPCRLTLSLGGFFEFNAGYFSRETSGYYVGYPLTNGSFMIAYGPALGLEFSAMVSRIINGKYLGDLFGAGLELLVVLNLPYFFPDYAYEYFLNIYLNAIVHLLSGNGIGLDVIAGFNFALTTEDYSEASASVYLDKYGFSIGLRMQLDFHNFDKPQEPLIGPAPAGGKDSAHGR